MKINSDNYAIGNRAMASVFLLYYHMIQDGGFTNDQTVYSNSVDVDLSALLDVQREGDGSGEIDDTLIREGAVISLLCDLDDMIGEFEEDYQTQPYTKSIISKLRGRVSNDVPESRDLVDLVADGIDTFSFEVYREMLTSIYEKYVFSYWARIISNA